MSCCHGRVLPALILGLLAAVGCTRWQNCAPQMNVAPPSAVSSTGTDGLTPAQAAQLCRIAGEALEKKGFPEEALRQYENARKHDPNAPAIARHLAVLHDLQGDAASAEREYQRALQEQPRDAELLNDFGYFHYRHNHLQAAESWLRNATTVDPNCACAWTNLGQVLAAQGRAEESYQAFTHVLAPAEAYSNLGILLAKHGRTAEARKALQQAVKLNPQLMQPRAFLNALGDMPGPLPPGLTRSPAPAPKQLAVTPAPVPPPTPKRVQTAKKPLPTGRTESVRGSGKPTPVVRAPAPARVENVSKPAPRTIPPPPRMESKMAKPIPAAPISVRVPAVPARPMMAPLGVQELPVIVNGPIQPQPLSARPSSGPSLGQPLSMKTSMAPLHKTPPSPPPAPPSPPPLALLASGGNAKEPLLIRTSAITTQRTETKPSLAATTPRPRPLPDPLAAKPLPSSPPKTVRPQAVLTDCQGEQEQ